MTRAIRPIPGITIAVALSLLVAGCAAIPNPLLTPPPPDALHPNPPIAAAVPAAAPTPDPTKLDEVARQRAIWAQQGIHSYRLTLMFGCQCALGGGNPVEVTVADDAVTGATVGGRALSDDERTGYPMSIGEHLGYPLAVGVDPDVEVRDDSVRIVVTRLVPGR